jgi:osmotically-inducible protein OsmY
MMNSPMTSRQRASRLPALVIGVAAAASLLGGCVPLIVGGAAVGGTLVAVDRRSTGIQVEDQSIELKASARAREAIGDKGRVSVTSYNRVVLLTGEVAGEAEKTAAEQAIGRVENVRSVVNELVIGETSSVGSRSNDTLLTSKVKATLLDAKDVQSGAFKVVTEHGTVYLMGRLTEREATRGAELARSVAGVNKVVRVVEILSDQDFEAMRITR